MEGSHRGRQKVDSKLRLEEQLVQIVAREGSVRNGKDDELNEECERLSRVREDKINALMAGKGPPKGASRNSMAAQRKVLSDEFESQMQGVQERLLKELDGQRKRIKEEMANRADASGVQAREKRKTRHRVDPDAKGASGPGSVNYILNRLAELEGKVLLSRDELDDDLGFIRREGGGTTAAKGKQVASMAGVGKGRGGQQGAVPWSGASVVGGKGVGGTGRAVGGKGKAEKETKPGGRGAGAAADKLKNNDKDQYGVPPPTKKQRGSGVPAVPPEEAKSNARGGVRGGGVSAVEEKEKKPFVRKPPTDTLSERGQKNAQARSEVSAAITKRLAATQAAAAAAASGDPNVAASPPIPNPAHLHKVYTSNSALHIDGKTFHKGDSIIVHDRGGADFAGTISSVNTLQMNMQMHGKSGLHKITLASMRSGKSKLELVEAACKDEDKGKQEASGDASAKKEAGEEAGGKEEGKTPGIEKESVEGEGDEEAA